MRVVVYACNDGHNRSESYITMQLSLCVDYARQNGYTIVDTYVDRVSEDGMPWLTKLKRDAQRRTFDAVLVYKLDRLVVEGRDYRQLKPQLKQQGIRVLSATEYIPETAEGVLVESMLIGMSDYVEAVKEAPSKGSLFTMVSEVVGIVPGAEGLEKVMVAADVAKEVFGSVAPVAQQPFRQPYRQAQQPYGQAQQPGIQPYREPVRPKPTNKENKDRENFWGKHITAILAGVLLIAASIATVAMSWNAVSPLVRFLMLVLFGSASIGVAVAPVKKLPEFLRYTVIRNLFASTGLIILFIDFMLGYSTLNIYPMVIGAVLLAFWSGLALVVLKKFKIVSAAIVGAIGVIVGCGILQYTEASDMFTVVACLFACFYYVAALYMHKQEKPKPTVEYVFYVVCSVIVVSLSSMSVQADSIAFGILTILAVAVQFGLLYIAKNIVFAGNLAYALSLLFSWFVFYTVKDAVTPVYAYSVMAGSLAVMLLRPVFLPAALAVLLCTALPYEGQPYTLGLVVLSSMVAYTSINSLGYDALKRHIVSAAVVVLGIITAWSAAEPTVTASLVLFATAVVFNRFLVSYFPDKPYGQALTLETFLVALVACNTVIPTDVTIYSSLSILLSGVLSGVFVLFGTDKRVDTPLYRKLLLMLCVALASGWGVYAVNTEIPLLAFVGILVFTGAIFYKYVLRSISTMQSVSALSLVSAQLFLWLNMLVPSGFGVFPSVVMIALGFWIISYGFEKYKNAERMMGLILVILSTVKAVSIDVWMSPAPLRVVALFVGAGICIAVSRLYAKQTEKIKTASEEQTELKQQVSAFLNK